MSFLRGWYSSMANGDYKINFPTSPPIVTVFCKNYGSSDQLTFIGRSGSNRSAFYLCRATCVGLSCTSPPPLMCMSKCERGIALLQQSRYPATLWNLRIVSCFPETVVKYMGFQVSGHVTLWIIWAKYPSAKFLVTVISTLHENFPHITQLIEFSVIVAVNALGQSRFKLCHLVTSTSHLPWKLNAFDWRTGLGVLTTFTLLSIQTRLNPIRLHFQFIYDVSICSFYWIMSVGNTSVSTGHR